MSGGCMRGSGAMQRKSACYEHAIGASFPHMTGERMSLLRQMLAAVLGALLCAALPSAARAERIVAIGDLHGDYAAFVEIIEAAGVGDGKGRWTGGDTIFVQ